VTIKRVILVSEDKQALKTPVSGRVLGGGLHCLSGEKAKGGSLAIKNGERGG